MVTVHLASPEFCISDNIVAKYCTYSAGLNEPMRTVHEVCTVHPVDVLAYIFVYASLPFTHRKLIWRVKVLWSKL